MIFPNTAVLFCKISGDRLVLSCRGGERRGISVLPPGDSSSFYKTVVQQGIDFLASAYRLTSGRKSWLAPVLLTCATIRQKPPL